MKPVVVLLAFGLLMISAISRKPAQRAPEALVIVPSGYPISLCGKISARTVIALMDTTRQIAPWMKNLGNYHFGVSTSVEQAQYFFNQGLTLYYGFNHLEAFRSFKEAARLDPSCAMAYWGQALALGPNINAPMDPSDASVVFQAVQKALLHADKTSAREQALIRAISKRYVENPPADRGELDQDYAQEMKQVASTFAVDVDVLSLYAEALMDIHPWNYWLKSGEPQPWTPEIVSVLEQGLKINSNHPGANHLYIHIEEASPHPDKAEASADRLQTMIPGAGHLVHMPSHIYLRIGRYTDGVRVNKLAVKADEEYITQCKAQGIYPLGYYPHNYHFMWACAQMAGQGEEAIQAARKLVEKVDITLMGSPDWATLQHYYASVWYALLRFGHWKEIIAVPKPADPLLYASAIWEYAQGLARLRLGKTQEAQQHLASLIEKAKNPALADLKIWGLNSFGSVISIAALVLEGEVLAAQKKYEQSINVLHQAVTKEDALTYQEPPDWYHPVRQTLGAVQVEAGKFKEAEITFRDDLKSYWNNGWSLYGLTQALEKQGKSKEAAEAKKAYAKAFAKADITLSSARK